MIHVCVGTDQRMRRAEKVLEHSIRKHTDAEVEMHWMRAGDEGWTDWRSQPSLPYQAGAGKWATLFTGFRFCVPEVLGFEGFGIYLDADMMVLGDIADLYSYRKSGSWASVGGHMPVGVIDCSKSPGISIDEMRTHAFDIRQLITTVPLEPSIPPSWNACDVLRDDTKLLHFTNMETQPWKPWPERFSYRQAHRCKKAVDLFFAMEKECSLPS